MRRLKATMLSVSFALAFFAQLSPAAPALAFTPGMCDVAVQVNDFVTCDSGDKNSKTQVALLGDSHTRSWFGPVSAMTAKYKWHLTVISKSGCPPLDPTMMPAHLSSQTCLPWNQKLQTYLKQHPPFDLVFNMSSTLVSHGKYDYGQSFASVVKQLTARGAKVVDIRDNPKPAAGFKTCIAQHPTNAPTACARPRLDALQPSDPMPDAVRSIRGVTVADFTDAYCGANTCSPVISGIKVYRDHSHITPEWAMHLLPRLEALVPAEFKR
jgi:SGNH domain (fused to AT3 domains)